MPANCDRLIHRGTITGDTLTPLPSSPTPSISEIIIDGDRITIFVEPSITHQIVKDVTGENFINVFGSTKEPLEPVSIYNLEALSVRVARVRMTLEEWEPITGSRMVQAPIHPSMLSVSSVSSSHLDR